MTTSNTIIQERSDEEEAEYLVIIIITIKSPFQQFQQ